MWQQKVYLHAEKRESGRTPRRPLRAMSQTDNFRGPSATDADGPHHQVSD